MIKIFENIKDYIDEKHFDFITNKEFNGEDPSYLGEISDDIAEQIYGFIEDLITDETLKEKWVSDSNAQSHFEKHCIGNQNKKSTFKNLKYDFTELKEYEEYENKINYMVSNPKYRIVSLYNTNEVMSAIKDLISNPTSILFSTSCGFTNNRGDVQVAFNSFANDVTTNEPSLKSVNVLILSKAGKTISMYPIDANLIENQFRKIANKHNKNKEIQKLYKNKDK